MYTITSIMLNICIKNRKKKLKIETVLIQLIQSSSIRINEMNVNVAAERMHLACPLTKSLLEREGIKKE